MPTQHRLNNLTKALRLKQAFKPMFSAVALAATLPLAVQAQVQEYRLNIPAQPLNQALQELASKTGVQLLYNPEDVEGLRSTALNGSYQLADLIRSIIQGTGLNYGLNGNTVTLQAAASDSLELSATEITSQRLGAITEGTGSYTTGLTSTATRMNLSIRETPQSISVVTRQRMDDQNLTSITDVLEQTPGVTISRDTGERFNIYSRGNQISKYQYDGLTTHVVNDTQNLTQTFADMSIYDRVEVVRGATGLMTGAGVPSGMINMVRKKPTKDFQASLAGSVGRWDDYRGQVDVSGPLIESGKLRARLVGSKQDNDTFTDNYNQKRDVLYGVAEADITDSTTLRFGIDHNKYEVNGGTGVPLNYSDGGQTNFSRSTTVVSKHQNEKINSTNYFFNIDQALANDWKLVVAGNYMDAEREVSNILRMKPNTNRTINRATGEYRADGGNLDAKQTQKSATINAQGPFTLFGRQHQAIVGYEFSRYKNDHTSYGIIYDGTSNISDPNKVDIISISAPNPGEPYGNQIFYAIQRGYYGALRLNPIENLHVIFGARISDYKYDGSYTIPSTNYFSKTNYQKSGEVTPYAGLVYDLTPEQSIYASYTDIFTPNNVNDINGKVIDPEVGSNYEIGWKGEFYDGRLNTNIAIYKIKRDNAAELAGYDSSNIAYFRAIDGMKTKGLDIEISGEVLSGWNVSASYSHSRSEDGNGNRETTGHPLDTVKLWNTYKFSGDLEGLTIGGGARWISKTDSVPITSAGVYLKATQEDFALFDAMARYKLNQHLSATLNINNLLDKKYYTAVGDFGYGYYGAPRNITVGARYDF